MKVSIIDGGNFKLDGGAMFGVVPKSMWQKLNMPDENSMCTWSMRLILIETGDRKILVDCGIGRKQNEKFRQHFHPHNGDIHDRIEENVINPNDITDVLLTHLHFDHCGGALFTDESGNQVPTFPNATYWSCEAHFDWAYTPNDREKASFLKENFVPLRELGKLKFVPLSQGIEWIPGIKIHFYYGHTHAMMVPEIMMDDGTCVFYGADLLPSSYHVRMPYVMAYDIRPLQTMQEKKKFYEMVLSKENSLIIFEHDPVHPYGKLILDDRGRYGISFPEQKNTPLVF